MQRLRRLVCGMDFSECAECALDWALALALRSSAQITLVHVCELGADGLDERRLIECGEALSAVIERRRHSGVEITGVLRSGRTWEKLDNVAAQVGADLIVVGRHGAGRRARMGSVADELVRGASRAVLIASCEPDCLESAVLSTKKDE